MSVGSAGVLAVPGRRSPATRALLWALLIVVGALALTTGAVEMTVGQVAAILAHTLGIDLPVAYEPRQAAVLLSLRLPRVLLAGLVGLALATSGAATQGLFRNPLADPALLGVSGGAALGAVTCLLAGLNGHAFPELLALPALAGLGGLAATLSVYRLSSFAGRTVIATMLLAGLAVNALTFSGLGLVTYLADETQLRSITFWMLGSLGGATWSSVAVISPFLAVAMLMLMRSRRALNALLLGEDEAGHLGLDIQRLKRRVVLATAMATGAAVAVSGIIGFVGLIVPHLVRLLLGPDHRGLLPGSALVGAALLIGGDTLARTVIAPAELPIGIVTATLGAPFFIWLLRLDRSRWAF